MNSHKFKTVTNIYTGEETDSNIVNAKEIEIIKRLVTKDDIVLDIGANVGFMTIQLAQLAKHVYAFEPSPYNFKQLETNTQHLDNVTTYEMAVSNTTGFNTLYICPHDNGMNRLYDSKWCKGGDQIRVSTVTIDFVHKNEYVYLDNKKINFIKLDVEGYEYKVLQGMRQLLQRDHPTMLMEFHPPSIEEAGDSPRTIYDLLKNEFGYNDPINCNNNDCMLESYNELDKQTRDIPAVNILWQYNHN